MLWEPVLLFVLAVVVSVLWRSPAPDSLWETHVLMFTRKHRVCVPLRISAPVRNRCLLFQAPQVTPALVGMLGPWSPLAILSSSGRWEPSQCWYGNHSISHIWEEPDLPVSCYCGALAPDLARACRAWGVGRLGPCGLPSPGGGIPTGSPILEWEPAPRLQALGWRRELGAL